MALGHSAPLLPSVLLSSRHAALSMLQQPLILPRQTVVQSLIKEHRHCGLALLLHAKHGRDNFDPAFFVPVFSRFFIVHPPPPRRPRRFLSPRLFLYDTIAGSIFCHTEHAAWTPSATPPLFRFLLSQTNAGRWKPPHCFRLRFIHFFRCQRSHL